jgi:hypothetical protein
MPDDSFLPADRHELRDALSFALRYDRRGKATRSYQNPAADAAAEHLVDALERNGFVVMRRSAAPAHAAPPPPHAPET